jgi:Asp/Glu/hydantoin racemase
MESPGGILVINPNSNEAVTAGMDAALDPFRFAGGPAIRCTTLVGTPFGIESQRDAQATIIPLLETVGSDPADAFVIACFGDPGLQVCREATRRPVFGIAESAVLTALARGDRFGVISLNAGSARSLHRYLRQMGLASRLAAARPLGLSVAESAGEGALARMVDIGRELIAEDGADVVIMGCGGMSRHRRPLEEALGAPVIDPTQAAVAMAIGAVALGRQAGASAQMVTSSGRGALDRRVDRQPVAGDVDAARDPDALVGEHVF